jgi:PilX N-terminal
MAMRREVSSIEVIMKDEETSPEGQESGFALILAILSLLLLTFLGLTLAATTSTELTIATNYRWSQQAYYNAEAGLAVARAWLVTVNPSVLLPDQRSWEQVDAPALPGGFPIYPTIPHVSRNDEWGNAPRNFAPTSGVVGDVTNCDHFGAGVGYGVVFDDGVTPGLPLQNKTQVELPGGVVGPPLRGAFTVWVRRPLLYNTVAGADPEITADNPDPSLLIVTVEGVAPTGLMASASANQAVRVVEANVRVGAAPGNTCATGTNPQYSDTGFHCMP